ncbi:unnamed protein product, partial [Prorocentrum cordatum]
MARSASLLLACGVAACAALLAGSLVLSFVGTSLAPAGLRAGQRSPSVEMQFFGGEPVTTTPPPPAGLSLGDVSESTYVISMTILFFGSARLENLTVPAPEGSIQGSIPSSFGRKAPDLHFVMRAGRAWYPSEFLLSSACCTAHAQCGTNEARLFDSLLACSTAYESGAAPMGAAQEASEAASAAERGSSGGEDDTRLRNECDMYINQQEIAVSKYEAEIKLRIDSEVKLLDKTRKTESLEADLEVERREHSSLAVQLKEEISLKEVAVAELETRRSENKQLEKEVASYKQNFLDQQQQKLRADQQVVQLKQQVDRMTSKVSELKDNLVYESEQVHRLTEQKEMTQRDMRRLERQVEDDSQTRKELENDNKITKEKLEHAEKDLSTVTEERRELQKQLSDLNMEHRTSQIERKRQKEMLERAESQLEKVQREHHELLDNHRLLTVEVKALRDDVASMEENLKKEADLRKSLQADKKHLLGSNQVLTAQLDSSKMAV